MCEIACMFLFVMDCITWSLLWITDGSSRNQSGDYNAGSYRYGPEDPHRMPPLPLKKQHMFGRGKRDFSDNL